MFHSAALKLTVWYLAIIVTISLIFSGLFYQVSSQELERNVNRQLGYFNNFLGPRDIDSYNSLRQRQISEDRSHLKANLIVFNLLVLAGGGAGSYWLARRTLKPIEDALSSQSRFAADASHELRTPLTAIQAENEVALRNRGLTKAQAVSLLKSNLEEVAKLKTLSEGLLRLASGAQNVGEEHIAVGTIIEMAIQRQSKAASAKKIEIISQPSALSVRGDLDGLSELVSILLDNAVKYSPPKSKVNIMARQKNNQVSIKVSDEGQGIAAADLPHIFERFYRTDSSRNKNDGGGYGLGLAIAKKIAELHNGYISVESSPNKGSAFTLSLPAA
jgi:signal transduction histidine kinase